MARIKIEGFEDRSVEQIAKEVSEQAARFMIIEPEEMSRHLENKKIVSAQSGPDRDKYRPDSKQNYNINS